MSPLIRIVLLCICCLPTVTFADAISDIIRGAGSTTVNTDKNIANRNIDAERRKKAIDTDAQRQIARLDTLIAQNDRRITDEYEREIGYIDTDLMSLQKDFEAHRISTAEYQRERRALDNRKRGFRKQIDALDRQNEGYQTQKEEILRTAEFRKQQVDIDTQAATERAKQDNEKNILDRIIRGLPR